MIYIVDTPERGFDMPKEVPEQGGGLSRSEKMMLIRAVVSGLLAVVATLWINAVFSDDSSMPLGLILILACLLCFIVAVTISIMGESFIEDFVKLILFSIPWLTLHYLDKFESFELIAQGICMGSVVGFVVNRMLGKK